MEKGHETISIIFTAKSDWTIILHSRRDELLTLMNSSSQENWMVFAYQNSKLDGKERYL